MLRALSRTVVGKLMRVEAQPISLLLAKPRLHICNWSCLARYGKSMLGGTNHHDHSNFSSIGSSTEGSRGSQNKANRPNQQTAECFSIGQEISNLGWAGEVDKILQLCKERSSEFDSTNFISVLFFLSRNRYRARHDPVVEEVLQGALQSMETYDKSSQWFNSTGMSKFTSSLVGIGLSARSNRIVQSIAEFVNQPEVATALVENGTPLGLSKLVWSLAKLNPKVDAYSNHLFQVAEQQANWMFRSGSAREISNFVWAFGAMGNRAPLIEREIELNATFLVDNGNPQDLSNIALSCAKLGMTCQTFFALIDEQADWLVREGAEQAITNTAWACGSLEIPAPHLFSEIERTAERFINTNQDPQGGANIAWACGVLGYPAPNVFAAIERNAELFFRVAPKHPASIALSCSRLGIQLPRLFKMIDRNSNWMVKQGNTQAVANSALALAKLQFPAPNLFFVINKNAEHFIREANPQEVANTAWAIATLEYGHTCRRFLAGVEHDSTRLILEGSAQNIGNICWAFAKSEIQAPSFFSETDKHAPRIIRESSTQGISNTAWSFAQQRFLSSSLMNEISKNAENLVKTGTIQCISNTAIAFAVWGRPETALFNAISDDIEEIIKDGSKQQIVNLCHSFAILDLMQTHKEVFQRLCNRAIEFDVNEFRAEEIIAMSQVCMYAKTEGVDIGAEQIDFARAAASEQASTHHSKSQRQISAALNEIGFEHVEEYVPWANHNMPIPSSFGILSVDIANLEKKIAIEVDGPTHFLKNAADPESPKIEDGLTRAKRRFLQNLGWKVINVPSFEFYGLSKAEVLSYLSGLVNEAESQPFPELRVVAADGRTPAQEPSLPTLAPNNRESFTARPESRESDQDVYREIATLIGVETKEIKIPFLKDMLQRENLRLSGNKPDLARRLLDFLK